MLEYFLPSFICISTTTFYVGKVLSFPLNQGYDEIFNGNLKVLSAFGGLLLKLEINPRIEYQVPFEGQKRAYRY